MSLAIVTILLVAPLLIYMAAAMNSRGQGDDPEGFFLASGKVSSLEFANTSVAYGFQIASVSLFLAWGYHYGGGALVNPLFWGVGIFLFASLLRRIAPFIGRAQTLHGFLGERYGSRTITVTASVLTMLGFIGAFTAELVWGSVVLSVLSPDPTFVRMGTALMGVLVLLYVTRAGHISVIRTDQYQLLFAHGSLLLVALSLVALLGNRVAPASGVGLALSIALLVVVAIPTMALVRQWRFEPAGPGRDRVTTALLVVMAAAALGGAAEVFGFLREGTGELGSLVGQRNLFSLEQGPLNLFCLALLPLCWQFADVTMWQRLGAIRRPQPGDEERWLTRVRLGLIRYGLESPMTWLVALLMGIALRYADLGVDGDTVYNGIAILPGLLLESGAFGEVGGALTAGFFAAGILAAMLSSADSFLMGSTFTFVYDLVPAVRGREPSWVRESPREAVLLGRLGAVVLLVLGLLSYFVSSVLGFDILSILFGAFSAQVSLFPAVAGTLLLGERAPGWRWALASLLGGLGGGAFSTAVALRDPSWSLYGPLWALGISGSIFLLGVLARRR